jgi:hypothetical protein
MVTNRRCAEKRSEIQSRPELQTVQYQDELTKLQEQYRSEKVCGERELQLQQDRKVENRVQALRRRYQTWI